MCQIELAFCHSKVDPPRLLESAPGHVAGILYLGFRTGGAPQLTPLELLQDLPLFGIQLFAHDDCLLSWSRVAFRLGMIVFRKRVPSVDVTNGTR